ncbi:MAG: lipopolysaccharide ABC transporter ATP-binding protein, partial [Gammaproteobacteria bacterium]|nr:lipopolysaccharide ABC transporter ATP-binding protein [Gammaproteobacteria bacterium]
MSQHKLEVKNLYKKYARRVVVNDVSFSVSAGEIVGLL